MPPDECFQLDDSGTPVTCVQQPDGSWNPVSMSTGPDPFGLAAVGFLVVLALGVATTAWRMNAARSMARSAGLDERAAGRMALVSEDGLTATYLASSLRGSAQAAPAPRDAATRLRELDRLRAEGLVTDEEHATRRAAILDDV